jgi:hypothetical protein
VFDQQQQFEVLEKQFEDAVVRREKQTSYGKYGLGANVRD